MESIRIVTDATAYGRRKHPWHPDFVKYMADIVRHPTYSGMPDAVDDRGIIQWESPSNRQSGKYRWTYNKRKIWWEEKAQSLDISTNTDQWISRTAKAIHPFGEKPCKRCGTVLKLSYVYPNKILKKRFSKLYPDFIFQDAESIDELYLRLTNAVPGVSHDRFVEALNAKSTEPTGQDSSSVFEWLLTQVGLVELRSLSPGAMSNAPDRLDGFHSFNLCCRSSADSGRSDENLRSYSTDRRAFEYWVEGNWVAADNLMAKVQTDLRSELTADGGTGYPTADHVGPISLGFQHRPEFRLLSRNANSARNNRMTLEDVIFLKQAAASSHPVASTHVAHLWDQGSRLVQSDEHALRLSKMMRDHQKNWLFLLGRILDAGHYALLASFLELDYADYDYTFRGLTVVNFITQYEELLAKPRDSRYALKQKVRRTRVAISSLRIYQSKLNRQNALLFESDIEKCVSALEVNLQSSDKAVAWVNSQMDSAFAEPITCDYALTHMLENPNFVAAISDDGLRNARRNIIATMHSISEGILRGWNDSRYVRAALDFDLDIL